MPKSSRLRLAGRKRGRRALWLFVVLGLLGCGTGFYFIQDKWWREWREFYVQLSGEPSVKAEGRGTFYDRGQTVLAESRESASLFIQVREISSLEETAKILAPLLNRSQAGLKALLTSGKRRVMVASDLSPELVEKIESLGLAGVHFQDKMVRTYPFGSLVSHLLGYVIDGIGFGGVEAFSDRLFIAQQGTEQSHTAPVKGVPNLQLTVDVQSQSILESAVLDIASSGYGKRIAACILEGGSGKVVGYYQFPSFDPNDVRSYSKENLREAFLAPYLLPDIFRSYLRDAMEIMHSEDSAGHGSWSILARQDDLGLQIRAWEELGFNDDSFGWFPGVPLTEPPSRSLHRVGSRQPYGLSLIPVEVRPLNLLLGMARLLEGKGARKPVVVESVIYDRGSGEGSLRLPIDYNASWRGKQDIDYSPEVRELFSAMSVSAGESIRVMRGKLAVEEQVGEKSRLHSQELVFVNFSMDGPDLYMLMTLEAEPSQIPVTGNQADPVARYLLPRLPDLEKRFVLVRFLGEDLPPGQLPRNRDGKVLKKTEKEPVVALPVATELLVMPDLVGLSLREGLRMLQEIPVKVTFEGTGKIVSQLPQAGETLEKGMKCTLVLQTEQEVRRATLGRSRQKNGDTRQPSAR